MSGKECAAGKLRKPLAGSLGAHRTAKTLRIRPLCGENRECPRVGAGEMGSILSDAA